jgi:hypothetical protein
MKMIGEDGAHTIEAKPVLLVPGSVIGRSHVVNLLQNSRDVVRLGKYRTEQIFRGRIEL